MAVKNWARNLKEMVRLYFSKDELAEKKKETAKKPEPAKEEYENVRTKAISSAGEEIAAMSDVAKRKKKAAK